MISIQTFIFNPFQENTHIVYDETLEALIIDPGCCNPNEEKQLHDFVISKKLKIRYILNTHGHIDHVLGNAFAKTKYHVPLMIHAQDKSTLCAVKAYAPSYGFPSYHEVLPDQYIDDKDEIQWGNNAFQVLFLPGHSPGHIGFYHPDQKIIVSGDVLFKNSIGRTDLPGGNAKTLMNSIQQKLFTLPDNVVVYPGHGPNTTLREEKASNPFCKLHSAS